jgi:hypothetical protein
MAIELPRPARVLRPDLHGIVTENDPLLTHPNFGERTPRGEQVLYLSSRIVVISVDEVDGLAGNLIAIEGNCFWSSHAEVPEEIEHVVWLHRRIHAFDDRLVHLLRVRERTVAVSNDVEVPEMKVGRKPGVSHDDVIQEPCFLGFEVVTVAPSAS